MSWGSFALAAGQVVSGLFGKSAADEQAAIAQEQLQMQRQQLALQNMLAMEQMDYGRRAYEREDELMRYYMDVNAENRGLMLDQMEYARDWAERQREDLTGELNYERYRIKEADRREAAERERQLQKLANDEALTRAERERALEELEYVRSIAKGEREFDVKRYQADRMTNELEYQYRLQQYERMMGIANEERDFAIRRQEDILREAGLLQDNLQVALKGLGDMPEIRQYGEKDVREAEADFYDHYLEGADRAADRLASTNEAGLIRAGVDVSSTGDSARRRLLQEQLVPLYSQARMQARNDALQWITGLQENELAYNEAERARRGRVLEELTGVNSQRLEALQGLRDLPSATRGDYLQLGSAVTPFSTLTSAGNYDSPLDVRSGVLDRGGVNTGYNTTMALQRTLSAINPSSFNPTLQLQMPSLSTGASLLSGRPPDFSGNALAWAGMANKSAASGTESLLEGLTSLGDMIGDVDWGAIFGRKTGGSTMGGAFDRLHNQYS